MGSLSTEQNGKPLDALSEAVLKARTEYILANPKSSQAFSESCQYMPGGNTRTVLHASPFPLTFKQGAGSSLTSLDGDTYLDLLGEYTAGIYGHNNPTIRAAIDKVLTNGWNFGGTNTYEKTLAKLVCQRFSPTIELVRFTNSGTEANMCAIAAAIAWTRRKKILVFFHGYHGSTISFHSVGDKMNLPHEWLVSRYNDIDLTNALLEGLPSGSLAAILVEPMLGSGGGIPGSEPFLRYLRKTATHLGALLIFDEVMTSRLSYRGLGYKLGIRPDLMTLGKWLGGGMTFGAFGGRRDIMEMFDPRIGKLSHAGTFNNNIVTMAAGCAGCELLDEDRINKLNEIGDYFTNSIKTILQHHGLCGSAGEIFSVYNSENGTIQPPSVTTAQPPKMWVSGIGSILVMHFSKPGKDLLLELFYHHMLQKRIYLAQRGFMALSIEITKKDTERFVKAMDEFIVKYKQLITNL
ncbi:hypothetical protein MMC34_000108 [Xylographa carneopallida]|nr:hypothetical protein [Xylographa carneopallida]